MMILIILIFLIFASIHSITASGKFKQACKERFGGTFMGVYYRGFYNLISAATFAAALGLISLVPDHAVWNAPLWLHWVMRGVQLAALVFGARSFAHLDRGEFLGTTQIRRYFSRREVAGTMEGVTERELVTTGVYGIVRHPLYLAGIIIVLFNPVLTVNGLTFTVLAVLYFLFGAFIEERRFLEIFGERYRAYKKRVPMLAPGMLRLMDRGKSGSSKLS